MSLFLPREIGSIETGPQTFAGTNVLNTTFLFIKEPVPFDGPGLLNSVLVQNGGYTPLNGTFNYTTEFEGKPYYNKDGYAYWFMLWFENRWNIFDFDVTTNPIYYSTEDVPYPWHVNDWVVFNSIHNPAPTVTKIL